MTWGAGDFDESSNASQQMSTASRNLYRFSVWYASYHGYVSIAVCLAGVVSSLLVIIVLTRRHMVNPTNYMLTALAVCDLLTMMAYIPFALQFYCLHGIRRSPERNNLPWAYFCLFYANFSVTTHTTSIWLAVVLSAFRYSCVRNSIDGVVQADLGGQIACIRYAIITVCLSAVTILIPNYVSLSVIPERDPDTNQTIYVVDNGIDYVQSEAYREAINTANFWIHALLVKLIPCALMCIFGFLLLWTVHRIHRRRQNFRGHTPLSTGGVGIAEVRARHREQEHNRTTVMLGAVVLLFLLTELPQGLLALVSGLEPVYYASYYVPLGDVMDIVALVNNAINFTLYCAMSKQFRSTFLRLFLCDAFRSNTPVAKTTKSTVKSAKP